MPGRAARHPSNLAAMIRLASAWRGLGVLALFAPGLAACSDDKGPPVSAVVWRSAVDDDRVNATDPPSYDSDAFDLTIDLAALVEPDHELCRDALQFAPEPPDTVTGCLLVQYRIATPVGGDEPVTLQASGIVNESGLEFAPLAAETIRAYGGATDALGSALFPNSGPGSTITISVDDDESAIALEVPVSGFEPVDWNVGSVADERV
jgi:hypothetical protein